MKLFKLTRTTKSTDYDYIRGAIVVAADEQSAKEIHPSHGWPTSDDEYFAWERSPQAVTAQCIGDAAPDMVPGSVVLIDARNG